MKNGSPVVQIESKEYKMLRLWRVTIRLKDGTKFSGYESALLYATRAAIRRMQEGDAEKWYS